MKPIVIILGIVFWILFQVIKANKKNAARGGQNTNNSPNAGQNFVEELKRIAEEQLRTSQQTANQNRATNTNSRIQDSFLNAETNVVSQPIAADHFREESLVEEYKRTRREGTTIKHHTHDYFQEKRDRQKAEKHTYNKTVRSSAREGNHSKSAVSSNSKPKIKQKTKHPSDFINLKDKPALKQAFVMAEVLRRPE